MTCELSSLFDVRYGHSLELNALTIASSKDGVAFVSRQMGHNGISAYVASVDDLEPAPAGDITCALGGNGVLTTYIQEEQFYCGRDVAILRPKVEMTKQQMLYYCLCIKSNRFRYNYGRQANKTLATLQIPEVKDVPNWVNATDLNQINGANESLISGPPPALAPQSWPGFRYDYLFDIKKGQRLTKSKMTEGGTPFIGSIDSNNGQRQYVSASPNHTGNTITVNYNGSVAEAFYQPKAFWASDDVNVLYPKFPLTPYIGLFVCSVIRQEKFRYNYGRKWHLERMNEAIMRLPSLADGSPDWAFMEDYIKHLPYSKSIQV